MSTRTALDHTPDQVIEHEASHAAAAVYLDVKVGRLSIVPFNARRGVTTHGRCDPVIDLIILLAPLISEDTVPVWPVRHPLTADEHHIAAHVKALDVTQRDYLALVDIATQITRTASYLKAHAAFARALRIAPEVEREHTARIVTALREKAA